MTQDPVRKSALDLVLETNRPKVKARKDILFPKGEKASSLKTSNSEEEQVSSQDNIETFSKESVQKRIDSIPKMQSISAQLDPEVLKKLGEHISNLGVSREAWIEAAIVIALSDEAISTQVDEKALLKFKNRQNWKKQRQVLTRMMNTLVNE